MSSPETETHDPDREADEQQQEEKPKLQLDVTVSREDVDRYFHDAFSELMPSAAVPGFRSGRAPRKLVESRFRSQISDQVKSSLLMDSMTQVTEEHDFSAISEPDFDFEAVEIPDEGPLTFEFDIEVRPEFDMPNWKGLKLDRLTKTFSTKDVDRRLEQLISRKGRLTPFDGPAEPDDYIVVNMTFSLNGRVVSVCEEQTIRIKPILSFPDGRLEGFQTLLVGAKSGDKKKAEVTVSHDAANVSLQGKAVEVEIEVLEVKRLELPRIHPELLDRLGGYETEGDLRDDIKEDLERRLAYQRQRRIRQQITSELTRDAKWDLPPDLLKRQARRELERAVLELKSAGYSDDEIQAYENELRQNSMNSTRTALQEHFILERIAEDEQIEADPSDYDREIALIAAQSNDPPRRVRARIEKKGLMDALRNQIIERKVIELITSHAEFTDVRFEPEQSETEPIDHQIGGKSSDQSIPVAKHGGDAQELQAPADRT